MRPPVVVVAFNRPAFLDQVLASLTSQADAALEGREIHLFQDGAVNRYSRIRHASDADIAASVDVFRKHFPNGSIHQSPDNIGICENYRRAERYLFQERDANVGYFLEDDLVLSPAYLTMMDRLHTWAATKPNVAYFAAYGDYYSQPAQVAVHRRELTTLDHLWGFGLIRCHWSGIQALLEPYYQIVCGSDYSRRDHRRIYALYENQNAAPRASSQDAAKAFACDRLGVWRANTVVPFARYIGNVGQHMTPEVFAAIGFDRNVVATEPLDTIQFPGATDIERRLKDQRALFSEVRRTEFAKLLAALPPREYNPMRPCDPDDVVFGFRLFLNREPEPREFAEHAGKNSIFTFVSTLTGTDEFRRMSAHPGRSRPCTREDVSYTYRLCLHRDPESERLFDEHVGKTEAGILTRATWDSTARKALWASVELAA